MRKKLAGENYAGSLDRLKPFLSTLRYLPDAYAKHLKMKKTLLIVGPDGDLMKFPLRRKEKGWVELGSHDKRRPRKQKSFPGRFSLATGESLDGFEGWRLVPVTPANLEAATVHAKAREYREACRLVALSLRPEYSAMLIPPDINRRCQTPELEDQVGPYLRKSPAEQRAFLGMMETDRHTHSAAG